MAESDGEEHPGTVQSRLTNREIRLRVGRSNPPWSRLLAGLDGFLGPDRCEDTEQ